MFEKDRPYAIINDKSGTALELSGPDYTSITVSEYRGGDSQKWVLIQEDFNIWSVRNLSDRGFLSVMEQPRDGVKVVGNPAGAYWEIQPIIDDPDYYRITLQEFELYITLSDVGSNPDSDTPVELRGALFDMSQDWKFQPV